MQILPTFMYKYCCVTFISSSDHGAHSSHVSHIVLNTNVLAVGVSAGDMWVFIYLFIQKQFQHRFLYFISLVLLVTDLFRRNLNFLYLYGLYLFKCLKLCDVLQG